MNSERLYTTISIAIILGLFYLFYQIISPFLIAIVWAMVFSITFYPLYKILRDKINRSWAASLITTVMILIIIIGPFTYILSALAKEVKDTYGAIEGRGFVIVAEVQEHPLFSNLMKTISKYTLGSDIDLNDAAIKSLKAIGKYIGEHISDLFKNIFVFAFNFVIMCLAIFYFLRDGGQLTEYMKRLIPFSAEQKQKLEIRIRDLIIAAIYGGVAVGVTQGVLGGIAFWALGLQSPVFWGTVMSFFSFIPLFGTFIVWGPASMMLFLSGSYGKGAALLVYGVVIISSADNILKPLIIGNRTKMHTLLIFFSVLGGIKFFGFIGFILGPLITILCLSLLEIYTVVPADIQAGETD